MDLRLVVYEPNGDRIGVLPHPLSVDLGQPLDDLPSLRVSYSAHAVGADLLEQPCEVAVELYDARTGAWTEHPDSRFLRVQRSGDVSDPTGARSYSLPGYGWQMRKIRLYPGSANLVDGKRGFLSATAGAILRTFVQEWHSRGGSSEFAIDFTTTTDSAGQPWDKILTIYYAPGIDLLTVLSHLAEQGVVDWRVSGRTLQVYNADTALGRDLATGADPVVLRLGRDVTDAPDQASLEDLVTDVYLEGEDGFSLELSNPNAQSPWGRWEEYLTQGGVSDEGTATILAQAALASGATERVQITRGLDFTVAEYLPWVDYQPGDYVRAPGDRGVMDTLRVRQVTLSRDRDGHLSGNVVLNDRFLESEIRRARRTNGIVNGAVSSGGSGAQPAPEGPDRRAPAAPEGLIVHTDAYLDSSGTARGLATLTWGLVDTDTSGTALEVGVYEVYHRPNVVGAPWYKATEVQHPDNTASIPGYDPGEEWQWKVRAVSRYGGVRGEFSASVADVIAADVDAPPTPSAPVLSTRLGVIRVDWDGLGDQGEVMPPDFQHTIVQMRSGDTWEHDFREGLGDWTPRTGAWNTDSGGAYGTGGYNLMWGDTGALDHDVTLVVTPPISGTATYHILLRYNPDTNEGSGFSWTVGSGGGTVTLRAAVTGWHAQSYANGVPQATMTIPYSQTMLVTSAAIVQQGSHNGGRVQAAHGPEGGDWQQVGVLAGEDTLVIPDQPYHEPRHFRLVSVDRSGNQSAPSQEASVTVTPLVDTDIYPDTIAAGHIMANAITADKIRAGAIEAEHIAAQAIDGKTITGALIRSAPAGARTEMTDDGVQVLTSSGTPLVQLGYGTATGMRIRDPSTGFMVQLASHVFGFASAERSSQFTVASGYDATPDWVRESTMVTYTAVTPRALVICSYQHTQGQGGGRLRCNVDWLIGGNLQFSAPDTEVYTETEIVEFPVTSQRVVTGLTIGATYSLRFAAWATKPWYLEARSITVIPL